MSLVSYLSGAATTGLSTPARVVECECPTEHTVAKLGHSRACPWFEEQLVPHTWEPVPGLVTFIVCGGAHHDGTPHDFDWATYADDTMSTGVCRCGMWAVHHSFWGGP